MDHLFLTILEFLNFIYFHVQLDEITIFFIIVMIILFTVIFFIVSEAE